MIQAYGDFDANILSMLFENGILNNCSINYNK